jgi:hypothetical protein
MNLFKEAMAIKCLVMIPFKKRNADEALNKE